MLTLPPLPTTKIVLDQEHGSCISYAEFKDWWTLHGVLSHQYTKNTFTGHAIRVRYMRKDDCDPVEVRHSLVFVDRTRAKVLILMHEPSNSGTILISGNPVHASNTIANQSLIHTVQTGLADTEYDSMLGCIQENNTHKYLHIVQVVQTRASDIISARDETRVATWRNTDHISENQALAPVDHWIVRAVCSHEKHAPVPIEHLPTTPLITTFHTNIHADEQ